MTGVYEHLCFDVWMFGIFDYIPYRTLFLSVDVCRRRFQIFKKTKRREFIVWWRRYGPLFLRGTIEKTKIHLHETSLHWEFQFQNGTSAVSSPLSSPTLPPLSLNSRDMPSLSFFEGGNVRIVFVEEISDEKEKEVKKSDSMVFYFDHGDAPRISRTLSLTFSNGKKIEFETKNRQVRFFESKHLLYPPTTKGINVTLSKRDTTGHKCTFSQSEKNLLISEEIAQRDGFVGIAAFSRVEKSSFDPFLKKEIRLISNISMNDITNAISWKKQNVINPDDCDRVLHQIISKVTTNGKREGFSLRIASSSFLFLGKHIINMARKTLGCNIYHHKGNSIGYFLGGDNSNRALTCTSSLGNIYRYHILVAKILEGKKGTISGYKKSSLRITNCSIGTMEKLVRMVDNLDIDLKSGNVYLIGDEKEMGEYLVSLRGGKTGEIKLQSVNHLSYPKEQVFRY